LIWGSQKSKCMIINIACNDENRNYWNQKAKFIIRWRIENNHNEYSFIFSFRSILIQIWFYLYQIRIDLICVIVILEQFKFKFIYKSKFVINNLINFMFKFKITWNEKEQNIIYLMKCDYKDLDISAMWLPSSKSSW